MGLLFINGSPNHNGNTAAMAGDLDAGGRRIHDEVVCRHVWDELRRDNYKHEGCKEAGRNGQIANG